MPARIICADVIDGLRQIPNHFIHCVVTSPPYYGLRDYGLAPKIWDGGRQCVHDFGDYLLSHHPGQVEQTKWKHAVAAGAGQTIPSGRFCRECGSWEGVFGQEPTLQLYIQHTVEIFRELKRVLHPSGTFWLNLGDSYLYAGPQPSTGLHRANRTPLPTRYHRETKGSKKNLGMIPARVAIALQDDGWILRQDIIWAKGLSFCPSYSGSVMPESTQDRCTWAYEHVFQFSVKERYFYDIDGCREPYADSTLRDVHAGYTGRGRKAYLEAGVQNPSDVKRRVLQSVTGGAGRNLRNVWVIPKEPFSGAHFATFPTKLIEPIVKLATSEKGCCPTCLAPWKRRTIREPVPESVQRAFEAARVATVSDTGRTDGHTHRKPNYRRKVLTTEWEPGCACGVDGMDETAACTVLDPFCGSGRAGTVATRLGRRFIGIDLNPEYCRMAESAIAATERDLQSYGATDIFPTHANTVLLSNTIGGDHTHRAGADDRS